jgi:hypothetical protein
MQREAESSKKRTEQKYDALKVKDKANREALDTLQTRIRVYEKFKGSSSNDKGLGELAELEQAQDQEDLNDTISAL